MKYMGSKRVMLRNGLGDLIKSEVAGAKRFVDLFSGSAVVAQHVACHYDINVLAFDLQRYSKVLADGVISRTAPFDARPIWKNWRRRAEARVRSVGSVPDHASITKKSVRECRKWAAELHGLPITRAYGGHYFSPKQSVWIDSLRACLPRGRARTVALSALIQAASQCAAAPGHTAQPFQPTLGSLEHLRDAWRREIVERTGDLFASIAAQCAKKKGTAKVADANEAAMRLQRHDLVFIDPPYSGVHYSRFYHVLESIARGRCGEVTGVGRYPAGSARPRSQYSLIGGAEEALTDLLESIAVRGARAILTFPDHACSNGLSGDTVREICREHFRVKEKLVDSKFSTLGGAEGGGSMAGRGGRHHAREMLLLLQPKSARGTRLTRQ